MKINLEINDTNSLTNFGNKLLDELKNIGDQLKTISVRMCSPQYLVASYSYSMKKGGDSMALVYRVTAGAPTVKDVTERRMTIQVNDAVVDTRVYGGDVTDLGEVSVEQNANVVLNLVDVDDAGNVSEPAVYTFVATDTVVPPVPGGFGVALLREE